jgi:hypothetical protein
MTPPEWDRAYAVGQRVLDSTVKRARLGTVTALDPFGYLVEFSARAATFMPEWNLAPAPHRTTTTAPAGWRSVNWSAGRGDRQGQVHDGTSTALCSGCDWKQACSSRAEAQAAARQHRAGKTLDEPVVRS